MGVPGRTTDLRALAQQAKAGDLPRFGLEGWGLLYVKRAGLELAA